MKFRTEYEARKSDITITPQEPVVGIGSCFAANIVNRMRDCLWNAINPLGTLFNPMSIEKVLRLCLIDTDSQNKFKETLFSDEGVVHSWLFDSSLSGFSEMEIVEKFKKSQGQLIENLLKGKTLIITFGTAFCYFKSSNPEYVVSNCHKQPSNLFVRRQITANEIMEIWKSLLIDLKKLIPEIKVIFTVSPVRHIRDGLHENNISKGILLTAVDELCRMFDFCHYFGAYEIVIDDLRDYRFYADDLVHPSDSAVEYIWEKFQEEYLDKKGKEIIKRGESICKRMKHRPIIATESQKEEFHKETSKLFESFHSQYPDTLNPKTDMD